MPRNGTDARLRLQHAALELFAEQGYDATTTAQIAARADVTERTYFRHFADKREVLFDGQANFTSLLTAAILHAPVDLPPLSTLRLGLLAVAPLIENNLAFNKPRAKIIAGSPALRERELAKSAAVKRLVADAFAERGLSTTSAVLTAEAGVAVLEQAIRLWLADDSSRLRVHIESTLSNLEQLL